MRRPIREGGCDERSRRIRSRCGLPGYAGVIATLLLAGCATNPDPHEGGFVNGVAGLAGGGYQRRIDERQDAYQTELDDQARLMAEAQAIERERAAVRGQLRQAESRLAAQRRRISQARSRLLRSGGSASASERLRRLDLAEARVSRTDDVLRSVDVDAQPVPELKVSSADIQRQLEEIDALVAVVGSDAF